VRQVAEGAKSGATRRDALLTGGALQDREALASLARLVRDRTTDTEARDEAAWVLGAARVRGAVPTLTGLLTAPHPRVRERAAYALREIADPAAFPALRRRLDDPDRDVRYSVVTALYACAGEPGMPTADAFRADEARYRDRWRHRAAPPPCRRRDATTPRPAA
jgi:HEAT repeat protein